MSHFRHFNDHNCGSKQGKWPYFSHLLFELYPLVYRKIPLIRPRHIYGQRTNSMGLYSGRRAYIRGGLIFGRKSTSICNLLNLLFFLFFQYKARVSAFFTSCKMRNLYSGYGMLIGLYIWEGPETYIRGTY